MSDTAQQIEIFREFADNELKNHTAELNTRYQNRELASDNLGEQAVQEHRQIFRKEMEEKIDELLTDENQYLRPALSGMTERFLEKLKLTHQA